ncbi:MAG: transposase [Burkholderiaceae bacterium]
MKTNRQRQVHQSYSLAFKNKAVKLAQRAESVAAAARQLKIPVANLHYWLRVEQAKSAITQPKPPVRRKAGPRRTYSETFKRDAVQKALESGAVSGTARELKVAVQTLHNWITSAEAGTLGITLTLSVDEIQALQRLCAERITALKQSKGNKARVSGNEQNVLVALRTKLKRLNR